jgi:hypothetical protein
MDFLLHRRLALKITKVFADERINVEMKTLSILCIGGRGQPMLAGGSGGGMEPKKSTHKKGGPLAIYSFYKILYISR